MSHAIRIEGLGKRYDINRGGRKGHTIRDALTNAFRGHNGSARAQVAEA